MKKNYSSTNSLPATQTMLTNAFATGFSFVKKQTTNMKKGLLLLMVLVSSICFVNAQNAIVGNSGFSTSWGSCGSNTGFVYFSAGQGTTYTSGPLTSTVNGATCYWRLGVDWGGTKNQFNNGGSVDVGVTPGTKYSLSMGSCASNGALTYTTNSSYRYIFKTLNASSTPTGTWTFAEIQGSTVQTISSTSQSPTTAQGVNVGQTVTVTANLSGSFATGQGAYLRYSTASNFNSSTVVAMSGSGTVYTAQIPAGTNTANATVYYYMFTASSASAASTDLTSTPADADLYTINILNNGGSNYSYTVGASTTAYSYYSTGAGTTGTPSLWTATSTWAGGVVPPSSSATANIVAGDFVLVSGAITSPGTTTVNGTLRSTYTSQTASYYGTMTVSATGTYDHNMDGHIIPNSTWTSGSPGATCLISGMTSTIPSAGLGQSFYHFTVNSAIATSVNCTGTLTTVNGNLTVTNTGAGEFRLASSQTYTLAIGGSLNITSGIMNTANNSNGATATINIGGDLNITGSGTLALGGASSCSATFNINGGFGGATGKLKINTTGTGMSQSSSGSTTITTAGDFELTAGTFQFQGSSSASKTYALNIGGNYNQTGGTFTGGSSSSPATVTFNGASATYTQSGGTVTSASIKTNYTVASGKSLTLNNDISVLASSTFTATGTLNCVTNKLSGAGTFTLGAAGTLMIGDAAGITAVSTASGSIQTTTARTYPTTASYTYNGSANQVTGAGLPATVGNFTIANTGTSGSNVVTVTNAFSLGTASTGTLTLTSGILNTSTNSAPITILNTSASSVSGGSSTCYIQGPLARTFTAGLASSATPYVFPIGASAYLPITYSTLTTGATAPVLKLQATSTGAGSADNSTLNSGSTGPEYWQSTLVSGNFTSAYITLGRQTAPPTATAAMGQNTSGNSSYASIGGATTGSGPCTLGPSTTLVTSGNDYFTMATLYYVPAPTITGFSVDANGSGSSDYVGSTITVTGTNLNSVTVVKVGGSGGTSATIASQSSNSLTFYAPNASGQIYVLNGGGNYTYATTSYTNLGYITTTTGDWNTSGTWLASGGVPASGATVTVAHAITVNATATNAVGTVTVNSSKSITFGASGALTVNTTLTNSGTIDMTSGGTLNMAASATLANGTNTFTYGTGTVVFAGAGTITGTIAFNNLTLNGAATIPTTVTVNGTLLFNSGASVSNAPTYGASSLLKYNTGSSIGRNLEWSTTTGAGYPANVQISTSGTSLDLGANGGASTARQCSGNLTIDAGTTLSLNTTAMSAGLQVVGNVNLAGTLVLSATSGGSIKTKGNWSFTVGGTFATNGRPIYFNGSSQQTISRSSSGSLSFEFIVNDNTSGGILLATGTGLTLTGAGNGIAMDNAGGNTFDLNGNTVSLANNTTLQTNSGVNTITSTATGAVIAAAGTSNVNGSGTMSFGANVTITLAGGFDFGSNLSTINGTLQINSGGYVNTNAPTYGSGSYLIYNSTGTYGRGSEWSATSGAGYPYNVTIQNSTTVNLVNGSNSYKKIAGTLFVSSGTLNISDLTSGSSGVGLEALGDIRNDGTITLNSGSATTNQRLKCANFVNGYTVTDGTSTATTTLSSQIGGDFEVTGNVTDNATFTANSRAIFFTGTGTQTIGGNAPGTFNVDYIVSIKSSGSIQLLKDLLTGGPTNSGHAITLNSSTDIIDLNGHIMTIGTATYSSDLSGSGKFKGGTGSGLIINGTGNFGTINLDVTTLGTTNLLTTFTVNRTSSGGITLGTAASAGTLTLTAGTVTLGANDLTINSSISGASSSNYIITNSTGALNQTVASSNVTYPIGTATFYNPLILNNTGGTSDTYKVRVLGGAPSITTPSNYIQDTWTITEGVAGGSNLAITTQWNASSLNTQDEGSTFSHSLASVGLYVSSAWVLGSTTVSGSGPTYTAAASTFSPADMTSGITCLTGVFPVVAPSSQANTITFSSLTSTAMTIGWTRGNGSKIAVFVKDGSGTITDPSNNTTYTASSDWASGSPTGSQLVPSGYYCVYNGTANSVGLTNLQLGHTYYVQAYEYNGTAGYESYYIATASGNPNNNLLVIAPSVTTGSATSVTTTSITLNGTVNANAASTATSFDYGLTSGYGTNATATPTPVTGTSGTSVSVGLTGLTNNTLYHWSAKGINSVGTTNGTDATFTTLSLAPTVGTASSITATGFTANWTAPANTGSAAITYTIDMSTDNTFATINSTQTGVSATNYAFTSLSNNTTYYYRVLANNAGGNSAYSAVSSGVVTLAAKPTTASTVAFANVTDVQMDISVPAAGNGARRVVFVRSGSAVNYTPVDGTSPSGVASNLTGTQFGTGNYAVYDGTGSGTSVVTVTGLTKNTTYYVAVYEYNNNSVGSPDYYATAGTGNQATLNPTFTTSVSSLSSFGNIVTGTNSTSSNFTVSGTQLVSNVHVAAPTGFTVSTDNSTFTSSVDLVPTAGTLSSVPVYVEFSPSTDDGAHSVNVALTATSATAQNVGVSANAISIEPTSQGTITFGTVNSNSVVINLPTVGNGGHRIIVAYTSAVTFTPTDGLAISGVNANYTTATAQTGGNKVVYDGTGSGSGVVTVTGLTSGTPYYFAVYDYNMNTGTSQNYLATSPGTNNTTTTILNYRAIATGNWNATGTWQSNDGSGWVSATATPTYTDGTIEIQSPYVVTVSASVTADQLTIDDGATLIVAASQTLTINDGTGTDITVGSTSNTGYLKIQGTITLNSGATASVYGTYEHNVVAAASLLIATWNTGSTCKFTGTANVNGGYNQTFYNFIWDCTNQSATASLTMNNTIFNGDFTYTGASANALRLTTAATNTANTITFNGNLNVNATGGAYLSPCGSSSGSTTISLPVARNISIGTGAVLDLEQAAGATSTWNLQGNLSVSGSLISTKTGTLHIAKGSGTQTFTNTSGTLGGTIIVDAGSTLDAGTSIVNGNVAFTVSSGATFKSANVASPGILTTSGTKTINGNLVFNGASAQTFSCGTLTSSTPNNVTVGSNGVTLGTSSSLAINGTLDLSAGGSFTTAANTLTINGGITLGGAIVGATGTIVFAGTSGVQTIAANTFSGAVSAATLTITNSSGVILNQTITVGVLGVTGGNFTVNAGKQITMTGASSVATGKTLTIDGTVTATGVLTVSGTMIVDNGGTYEHNQGSGLIPTATWNTGSTCSVTGWTTSTSAPTGLGQSFYNFTWNSPNQTSAASVQLSGALTTVTGTLTVNTYAGQLRLATNNSGGYTGNFGAIIVNGGSLNLNTGGSAGGGTATNVNTINVAGDVTLNNAAVLVFCSANTSYATNLNVGGNFTMNGTSTLTRSTTDVATLSFVKGAGVVQQFTQASGATIAGIINITVGSATVTASLQLQSNLAYNASLAATLSTTNNSTIDFQGYYATGSTAIFNLTSGSTFITSNAAGISTTAATGSLQVGGSKTYSTGANYIYNGSALSAHTGNALPATVNNLTINNSNGVTNDVSTSVAGTLTLTSGTFSIGANTLTLANPIAGTATNLAGGATSSITIAGGSTSGINIPSSVTALSNLTLNNSTGTTLQGNLSVAGTLSFTSGKLTTSTNTLTLGTAGTISGAGTGWVIGNLAKQTATSASPTFTYAIGDGTNYTPVALAFTGNNTSGSTGTITASVTAGSHAQLATSGIDASHYVSRYWTLTNSGISGFTSYAPTFTYVSGDNTSGTTSSSYGVRLYNGSSWSVVTVSGTPTTTSTVGTGVLSATGFGDFAIGNLNAAPSIATNPSNVSICSGAGTTFTAAVTGSPIPTPTVKWQRSTNGTTWVDITSGSQDDGTTYSGYTTATLTLNGSSSAINGYQYKAIFTNINGTATSTAATLTVTINTWTGGISSDWTNGANWCSGTVPASGENVSISTGTTYAPTLPSGTPITLGNITGSNTIYLNGNTLTVNGSISSGTTFSSTPSSSLILGSSSSGTLVFSTNTDSVTNGIGNLTINSTTNTIPLGTTLHVYGVLNVSSGATFDVNHHHLILHSDAAYGTAALGPVNDGSYGTISNTDYVSVQRYHSNKRAWVLMSAPLTMNGAATAAGNGSIKTNWQQQTYITAPSQYTSTGMDAGTNQTYCMLNWTTAGWGRITNTISDNSLIGNAGSTTADNKPFFLFVRGDRSVIPSSGSTTSTDVVLQATGALQSGDKNFDISSTATNGYALVANPYPAPISLETLLNDNPNLITTNTSIYYWDPNNSGTGGYTTAIYHGGSSWSYSANNGSNTRHNTIQSGQAFFVIKTASASAVNFKEDQKITDSSTNDVFGTSTLTSVNIDMSKGATYIDGVLGLYNNNYSSAVIAPTEDAPKFWGNEEGVGIVRTGKYLSMEARPEISGPDTTYLYMNRMVAGNTYTFKISAQNMPTNVTGVLVDKYLNTNTNLDLTSSTSVSFTVDTSAAAKSASRFMLVFNAKAPLYVSDIYIKASVKAKAAIIDWSVVTEKDVKTYTVEHSTNASEFTAINTSAAKNSSNSHYSYTDNAAVTGANYYRIKAINKDGSVQYSSIAKVVIGDRTEGISIYPNPIVGKTMNLQLSNIAAGVYTISMTNTNGQQVMEQSMQHAGGSVTETIKLPSTLASGIYQLRLAGNGGSYIETVIVK